MGKPKEHQEGMAFQILIADRLSVLINELERAPTAAICWATGVDIRLLTTRTAPKHRKGRQEMRR